MEYRSIKGFTGWAQLGVLLAFTGAGIILAGLAQGLIYTMGMHVPVKDMGTGVLKAITLPENANWARLGQLAGTFCLLFLPCVFYLLVCHGKNKFWLGFSKYMNVPQVVIGFFLIVLANTLAKPLEQLSKWIIAWSPSLNAKAVAAENLYAEQVSAMSNLTSGGELAVGIIMMAFLPAVFEELFFRGTLQQLFTRWWKRPLLAILVTSLVFSLIHASYYLFLSRALLGFMLGWMFYQSRNIWINIIAHFLNNAIVLFALYFSPKVNGKVDLSKADPELPLWASLLALFITALLCYWFEKQSAQNRTAIVMQEQALLAKAQPFYDTPSRTPSNHTA